LQNVDKADVKANPTPNKSRAQKKIFVKFKKDVRFALILIRMI